MADPFIQMTTFTYKKTSSCFFDMVCVDPLGELIKPSYETAHFPVLLERNGLRPIRFHDLRHTCASLLVSLDVNMKVIQRYLGHSNMSTTADRRTNVRRGEKTEIEKEHSVKIRRLETVSTLISRKNSP